MVVYVNCHEDPADDLGIERDHFLRRCAVPGTLYLLVGEPVTPQEHEQPGRSPRSYREHSSSTDNGGS